MSIIGLGVYKVRECTIPPNIRYQMRKYEYTDTCSSNPKVDEVAAVGEAHILNNPHPVDGSELKLVSINGLGCKAFGTFLI